MNIIRSVFKSIMLILLLSCCNDTNKSKYATVNVSFKTIKPIDSLIIYDKENSWEIKSKLDLSNKTFDTLSIVEKKLYTIYSFKNGKQGVLSEVILSPESYTKMSLKKGGLFGEVTYAGTFAKSNNFLAFYKRNSDELSEKIKSGVQPDILENYIQNKKQLIMNEGISKKVSDTLVSYVIDKYDAFSSTLKKKNTKYLYKKELIGKKGNNFEYKDLNDKTIDLSKFKGNYLYIDVWATWCKPCKVEAVYLKELEKDLEKSKNVKIISISIDKDQNKWKNYLTKNPTTEHQYYSGASSSFVKFYDIGALPRFILLDKEGNIINSDEIRPSNPELLNKLNSLSKD